MHSPICFRKYISFWEQCLGFDTISRVAWRRLEVIFQNHDRSCYCYDHGCFDLQFIIFFILFPDFKPKVDETKAKATGNIIPLFICNSILVHNLGMCGWFFKLFLQSCSRIKTKWFGWCCGAKNSVGILFANFWLCELENELVMDCAPGPLLPATVKEQCHQWTRKWIKMVIVLWWWIGLRASHFIITSLFKLFDKKLFCDYYYNDEELINFLVVHKLKKFEGVQTPKVGPMTHCSSKHWTPKINSNESKHFAWKD